MILLLLQIILYSFTRTCFDMNINIEQTWTTKKITVGLYDSLLFTLEGVSDAVWNEDDKDAITGSRYPLQSRINATSSFALTCTITSTEEKVIRINVEVLDQKEFDAPKRTWAIEDEVLTFKNVLSCNEYSHDGKVIAITNNVMDQIFFSSGIFRITKVSDSNLGIHKCDNHVIEIVNFKELLIHNVIEDTTLIMYQETQALAIRLPKSSTSSAKWSTSNANTNLMRISVDKSLMFEPDESTTEFPIIYTDADNVYTITVTVKRLTPVGSISPSNHLIENNEVTFECNLPHSLTNTITESLFILEDMKKVLQSNQLEISKRSRASCKRNPCYFACIHQLVSNNLKLQFTTNIEYHVYRPISVTLGATIIGMHGEGLAISIVEQENHKNLKWCSHTNQEISTPHSTETALMLILQYDMEGTLIYGIENSGNCGPSNQRNLLLYFMLSPLLSIDGMHNNIVRFMFEDDSNPTGAAKIFPASDGRKISYRLTDKSATPIGNSFYLFPDSNPPKYGYTRFELVATTDSENLQSPHELYEHSFLAIPYKYLKLAANKLIVYAGEYISLCAPYLGHNDFCVLKASKTETQPFKNSENLFLDKCLFLHILQIDSYTWECTKKNHDNGALLYSQQFTSVKIVEINFLVELRNDDHLIYKCNAVVDESLKQILTQTNTQIYPFDYSNGIGQIDATNEFIVAPSPFNSIMKMVCRVEIVNSNDEPKRILHKESNIYVYNFSHILYIGHEGFMMECRVPPNSERSITWRLGNNRNNIAEAAGKTSYSLTRITEIGKRVYSCTSTDPDNSDTFYVFHTVNIQASPVTMDISSNASDTYNGEEVEIRCQITKISNSIKSARAILRKVTDFTCGQYDMDCSSTEKVFSAQDNTPMVLILNLEALPSDQNNFECILEMENSYFRQLFTLSVQKTYSLSMLPVDKTIVTYLGADQDIQCLPYSATDVNIRIRAPDNKILTSVTGSSISFRISINDANQAGIYKCEIFNDDGSENESEDESEDESENESENESEDESEDESDDLVVIAKSRNLVINSVSVPPDLQFTSSLVSEKASRYNSILFTCSIKNVFATETGSLKITNKKEDCISKKKCSEMNFDRSSPPISINITYSSDDEDSLYFCVATIGSTSVEKFIDISYISKPLVTVQIDSSIEMKVGNPLNISCCVTSEEKIPVVINWKYQLGSVADLHRKSQLNCVIFNIRSLNRAHRGKFVCQAEISEMIISNEIILNFRDVRLNSNHIHIPNGANIAISSVLVLSFEIYETTDDDIIILKYGDEDEAYSSCQKSSEIKVDDVLSYLCSVTLNELGDRTLTLEYVDESTKKSHVIHTYRLTVAPSPTIVAFQEDIQDPLPSGGSSIRKIICSATGFVTEIKILSMINNQRNILSTRVVNHLSTNYDFRVSHEIFYNINDQDIPVGGIFKCEAISSISVSSVAKSIIVEKELKMEKKQNVQTDSQTTIANNNNNEKKANSVIGISIGVAFGVIAVIVAVLVSFKIRRRKT